MNFWHLKRNSAPLSRLPGPVLFCGKTHRLLTDLPPGTCTRLVGYLPEMPPERKAQLQAYGLLPGQTLRVLQHKPVTIIQVELTELALETELAQAVIVE
jgi:Fe2+ transport system protein FeoA